MAKIEVYKKLYEPYEVVERAKKACGWFGAIAAFSFINSLLVSFQADISFVIGLGVTMIVDGFIFAIQQETTGIATVILIVIGAAINLSLIGVFVVMWLLSRRGSKAAYIIGSALYFLDGLLFLLFRDWVGIAFHAFFLYMLISGYGFIKAKSQAETMLQTANRFQPELETARQ